MQSLGRGQGLQQRVRWRAQVRLAVPEGDDFERCAIEIWVKFRDEEELQRLSSHRQSGGERSVSTILYLIAIQARLTPRTWTVSYLIFFTACRHKSTCSLHPG